MTYTSNRFLTPEACDEAIFCLKHARSRLPNNIEEYNKIHRSPYICDNLPSESPVSSQLREWISEIIGYSVFRYFHLQRYTPRDFQKAQEIRKQLIEWMTIELEAKKKYLMETK